ncbi:MAG TPA: zf-HC2 domain-containing protein [Candidatus Acidoferrales bacterium]|nr:zf-HC2 domain-containing protein [Candidatus Acidoferrales bacterium]
MICSEVNALSHLYLSGELDATRSAEVAKHLATCAECSLQLQMHADLDSLLRQAILSEHISTAALDRRVRDHIAIGPNPQPNLSVPRRAFLAIAAAAILLLVTGIGYALFGNHPAPVYADAAADHHDEVIDQQPREWLMDRAAIVSLAEKHGVSSSAIAGLAPAGYHLGCARVCDLNGHPFLHLVFVADSASTSPDKTREVSLFLCPRAAAALPQSSSTTENGQLFHTPAIGPEHLACFETDRVTALVVTDQAGDAAMKFARFAAGIL